MVITVIMFLFQEELSSTLSKLVHDLHTAEARFLFLRTFFITEAREWNSIDIWRIDKFMMVRHLFITVSVIQGPILQSIMSLTCLLGVKMLTVLVSTVSNLQVYLSSGTKSINFDHYLRCRKMWVAFCWKNVGSFCKCKSYSHFFSAKMSVFMPYLMIKSFNNTFTKDINNIEQLGPDV